MPEAIHLSGSDSVGVSTRMPLVVDLDGTILRSDMLVETLFATIATAPVEAIKAVARLREGRAALKQALGDPTRLDLGSLPWNTLFIDYLKAERQAGRSIYLASASDRRVVDAVAAHLALFDGVFASDGVTNLKSQAKADILVSTFGEGGFAYAGNETADLAVWQHAGEVVVVNATSALTRDVRRRWPQALSFGNSDGTIKDYLKAIRVHQWLKNLLVLVPPLAAHQFTFGTAVVCLFAFLSFSLCASSVYVLNDLIDLGRDRAHPTKRRRPFAAGTLPVMRGAVMIPLLLGSALILACLIRLQFLGVLIGYFALTLGYSLVLKRQMMIDVVALACLYGVRLVAGGVAVDVHLSAWLAAFSLFVFCSLALVKRCTELMGRIAKGEPDKSGRAYQIEDLPMLESLAAGSGFTAVLVFALYISSPTVEELYRHPHWLWLICVILIYWVGRVLILTRRGKMDDDPVVFAAKDKVSLVCAGLAGLIVAASL